MGLELHIHPLMATMSRYVSKWEEELGAVDTVVRSESSGVSADRLNVRGRRPG